MSRLIELKNVSKSFEDTAVLKNINLYIRDKEFLTLLGPSGCGKTTTLRELLGGACSTCRTRATFCFDGVSHQRHCPPTSVPVNTVFQKYALFPHLDVYDERRVSRLRLATTSRERQISSQRVTEMLRRS